MPGRRSVRRAAARRPSPSALPPKPITAAQSRALGIATETDEALPIASPAGTTQAIGTALETDTALPLGITLAIGTATETDTAQPIQLITTQGIGLALEIEVALPIGVNQSRALGTATETDLARPIAYAQAAVFTREPTAVTLHARKPQVAALLRRPARGLGPFTEN